MALPRGVLASQESEQEKAEKQELCLRQLTGSWPWDLCLRSGLNGGGEVVNGRVGV